jgi:hypothetical protein
VTTRVPVAPALHSTMSCATTTHLSVAQALLQHCHAPLCPSTSCRSVALALVMRPVTASRDATTRRPDCTVSTALMSCIRTRRLAARLLVGRPHWLSPCVRSLRLAARLIVVQIAPALLRLCRASGRAVSPLDFLSVGRTGSRRAPGHCVSRRDYLSSGLHRLYCAYAVDPDAPSRRSTSRRSVALALTVHLAAQLLIARIAPALLHLCPASGRTVSTLDFSSVGSTGSRRVHGHSVLCRDYPSRGHNGYTSPMPRVWVPRHVARLIVDYFASCRLIIDYFAYTTRPVASARRAGCCMAHRRLLLLRRASRCLGTSRDSSSTTSPTPRVRVPRHVARLVVWLVVDYFAPRRLVRRASGCLSTSHGPSSTTSPMPCVRAPRHLVWLVARVVVQLVVDYFAYAVCPGASAPHAAHRVAHCVARHRLLHLRRASGCLGTSRCSSSTTSPTLCVRVPRRAARLVTRLIIDYFDYAACSGASARRAARYAACRTARRRLLHLRRASGCLGTSRGSSRGSSSTTSTMPPWHVTRLVLPLVVDYFVYAVCPGALARRASRCQLLCLLRMSGCLGTSCD